MRRRLYFMLPDIQVARQMLDEMLLARIGIRSIRFLAKRDTLPLDLPEAGVLHKTDIVHGAGLGLVIGGAAGVLVGGLLAATPLAGVSLNLGAVLIVGLSGALFGAWASSLAGTQVPNSKLKAFAGEIEDGKTLMIVDVPRDRVEVICELVARRHPHAVYGGIDPTIPAFP